MHEKDIELARLLIARQQELNASGAELRSQQAAVQQHIDDLQRQAAERDTYADILARAADLLQRSDLTVEAPDNSEEEQQLAVINDKLAELEAQEGQFRDLVDALRERAPQLFDAATGELKSADSPTVEAPTESPTTEEASEPSPVSEAPSEHTKVSAAKASTSAAEEAAGEAAEDWDESVKVYVAGRGKQLSPEDEAYLASQSARKAEAPSPPPSSAPDEPLTDEELDRFVTRFNMDVIQRQALQSLGADACFVVDGASVMNNIPYYDHSIRGGPEKFIREELLRDFGLLARHLDRRVFIVLDQEHAPENAINERVELQTLRGADQGQRSAQDTLLKSVLADAAQRTQVCLVTGELSLGGSLRSRRVQFLPVSEFFRM